MTCSHPLIAWRYKYRKTESGKSYVTLKPSEVIRDFGSLLETPFSEVLTLPCGKCSACRLSKSREWAVRCVHEAFCYERNCFITLTYDNEHIPLNGSHDGTFVPTLLKSDLQKFWKRLRKRYPNVGIRYYAVGEYGSKFQRPHYHAIVFNFDFADKYAYRLEHGVTHFRSNELEELWPLGICDIGEVNFKSAAYVARYCLKKQKKDSADYEERLPEFSCMSLKPGIGFEYYKKFTQDIYDRDIVVIDQNLKLRPPRYYDKLFDVDYPEASEILRECRGSYASSVPLPSDLRLLQLQKFTELKIQHYKRNYESGDL